jgi:hypothetical protein
VLLALAEKKIGRRDQANNWIWRCANMTREVHEEYAVQRWPETKRLLGLLVNSSGGAHARNARRLVHASRQQDRRLSAALLAAATPHTAEAGEVINGARTRMSRKPAALARELLRNFPKAKSRGTRRRKKKGAAEGLAPESVVLESVGPGLEEEAAVADAIDSAAEIAEPSTARSRRRRVDADSDGAAPKRPTRRPRRKPVAPEGPPSPLLAAAAAVEAAATGADGPQPEVVSDAAEVEKPAPKRRRVAAKASEDGVEKPAPKRRRRRGEGVRGRSGEARAGAAPGCEEGVRGRSGEARDPTPPGDREGGRGCRRGAREAGRRPSPGHPAQGGRHRRRGLRLGGRRG